MEKKKKRPELDVTRGELGPGVWLYHDIIRNRQRSGKKGERLKKRQEKRLATGNHIRVLACSFSANFLMTRTL